MHKIEIDDKVFKELQNLAVPFVDTPNTVLSRLLFDKRPIPKVNRTNSNKTGTSDAFTREVDTLSTEAYIRKIWQEKFKGTPRQTKPFRMMFENQSDIVYFQNFNKTGAENLWFRLNAAPLRTMRSKKQKAWVCFTNPAENYGFLIPLTEIETKIDSSGWDRDEWEVNIHVSESRWRELDWRLDRFEFNL